MSGQAERPLGDGPGGRPRGHWTDRSDLTPLEWWGDGITTPAAFVSDDLAALADADDAEGDGS